MNVPDTQIAVAIYNFRDHCRTESDLATTLKRLRDIGYSALQMWDAGDVPTEVIAGLLEENEIYCCSTHDSQADYSDNFERTVQKQRQYGCALSILASPGRDRNYFSAEGTMALAAELNQIGRRLKEQGIGFGYHNHHREFARFTDKTMLEELVDNTDPETVTFEVDLHWVQRGGGSPVKWIKKVAGRMPVVHFKDFSIVEGQPVFSEIGEGNLDWEGILAACQETKVRWYVIEQDQPIPGRSIFESARISYENMVDMGLK